MDAAPLVLRGEQAWLVPLEKEHVGPLCEVGLDPELWRDTTIRVQNREQMLVYVQQALQWQIEGTCVPFVVQESGTGQIIGSTRFHHIERTHRRVEIGFTWLGVPWQGKGLNAEIKQLMLRHAFEAWNCVRVEFRADSENAQSRRALEKIGAIEECTLRRVVISEHKGPRDLVVCSITASDWERRTKEQGRRENHDAPRLD
jgi:N-acetyltransferase